LIQVAQHIISEKEVALPALLQRQLIENGQLKFIVEYYLSEQTIDMEKVVDLISANLPQSIQEIADLDIQLAVLVLETFDDSLQQN
jgi:hypothetical protein